jgi:uncharacterized protein (TIGR02145 family)
LRDSLNTGATNKSVTWALSSDTAVTIVSQTGTGVFLQTLKPGGATLTATATGTLVKANTAITVTPHANCPDTVRGVDFPVNPTAFYKVGDFGLAGCWTTENLRDSINISSIRKDTVLYPEYNIKAYNYPNRIKANVAKFGLLYTWAAATGRTDVTANEGYPQNNTTVQGICPKGWHIPSDKEWSDIKKVVSEDATKRYSITPEQSAWDDDYYSSMDWFGIIGKKMKSQNPVNVATLNGTSNAYDATDVTKRGLDFLASGVDNFIATAGWANVVSHWTASSSETAKAYYTMVSANEVGVFRGTRDKAYKYSVRCKKN